MAVRNARNVNKCSSGYWLCSSENRIEYRLQSWLSFHAPVFFTLLGIETSHRRCQFCSVFTWFRHPLMFWQNASFFNASAVKVRRHRSSLLLVRHASVILVVCKRVDAFRYTRVPCKFTDLYMRKGSRLNVALCCVPMTNRIGERTVYSQYSQSTCHISV